MKFFLLETEWGLENLVEFLAGTEKMGTQWAQCWINKSEAEKRMGQITQNPEKKIMYKNLWIHKKKFSKFLTAS